MADTVQLGAPVGTGAVIAADDAGAAGEVQIIKLAISADGSATVIPADATVGLRVDPAGVSVADGGTLPGKGLQVGGTDGSVFQVMSTDNAGRPNVNVNGTVPVSGPLTDTQLRATPVPVSGTVTASGPLTDTQLRATPVPVSGTVTANLGTAAVTNAGTFAVQADTELTTRDLDIGAGTDTQAVVGLVLAKSGGAANVSTVDPLPVIVGGSVAVQLIAGTAAFGKLAANSGVDIGDVDVTSLPALPAGTNNIGDVDVLTLPGVAGTVAHDGADSGNPVKIGARARTSDVTAVAADDRADAIADVLGKQVTLPYALPGAAVKGTNNSTGTSDTEVIAAPGANVRLYITQIVVTNAHATVGTKVQIKSATTATGYPRVYAAAVGGGAAITFPVPLRLAVNEALNFACVTTGADVDVSASGYSAAA